MALSDGKTPPIAHVARFRLVTADAETLAAFYERAFGCRILTRSSRSGTDAASSVIVGLGSQVIELRQFDAPGRPYPRNSSASDMDFQHLAIVVADMTTAYGRLSDVAGWAPISTTGPITLPPSSGGVTAFKLRDPEGHPLKLLEFPRQKVPAPWRTSGAKETCLGIDHTAIVVSDTARSVRFYESLGLRISARSINVGVEQARLDDVPDPDLEVVALSPPTAPPHLELLGYSSAIDGQRLTLQANDIAATTIVFEGADTLDRSREDPDGHRLAFVDPR